MAIDKIWIVTKIKGYGCIGLFFLPFLLVGIGTLGYSLIIFIILKELKIGQKLPLL